MTPYTGPITNNGTYTLAVARPSADYLFYASGDFGGRTCRFGYVDPSGEFAPFTNAEGTALETSSSRGLRVPAPPSGLLAVEVSGGGDAPSILLTTRRAVG
jgi:hypothetical protein